MAKVIEYDVSDADLDAAVSGGDFAEAPKPGVYQAKIHEINPGYSKGENGKPDKSRPRLEVIYELIGDANGEAEGLAEAGHEGGSAKGARLWDYVSFSKAAEWKLTQFLAALGEVSDKKRKGKFNAEKHEGDIVKIRVKPDTYEGSYSPRVGGTWQWDGGEAAAEELDDIESELEDDDVDVTAEQVRDMKVAELKELAEEHDISLKGLKKKAAAEAVIEALGLEAEEADEEDEDPEWDDDFEDDEEEEEAGYTADQIRDMSPAELKALAKEQGVSLKGMKKSQAVEALIESLGLEDDEDDEEVPF